MREPHKVKISLNAAGRGSVEVDGRRMQTRSIELRAGSGQATTVILELVNVEIEAEVVAAQTLADITTTDGGPAKVYSAL